MTKKITFLITAALMLLTMMATTGTMWGQTKGEGDTHEFSQTLSQLLNNNATIAPINIAAQSYPIKKVTVHYRYNKTITDAVTIEVSVGGISWGTQNSTGTGSNYTNAVFEGTPTTGAVAITFTNNTGSGTGHGTFWVDNVILTEGPSSGTPYISANDVNIAYNATEGSIAYTVNNPVTGGTISASVTDGNWLTLGEGTTSPISFTCSANEASTARTANVRLTYTYGNSKATVTKDVTVTQAGNPNIVNNIEDITAAGTYTVKGTIVAMSTRGFVLGDGTGYVYYYYGNNFSTTYTIGDIVKLSGAVTASDSYKVFQFTSSATITAATESNYVAEDPTVISGADMDAQVASAAAVSLSNYIQYQGTLTVNNTYYNITSIDGASTAKGSISYPTSTDFTSLNGKVVTVTGYYVGVSSNQYYNTMIGGIEEVITSVAAPTFSPVAGAYTGTQSVTISCETEGSTIYYTTDGTTPTNESTQYTAAIQVSETTTIKAIAYVGSSASTVATATYTITQPLNTIEAIFAAATTTETSVIVTFNNWVVSGVSTNGKNVFVTDGTNGFVINSSTSMSGTYSVGNILQGTITCSLKLNSGYAQLTNVDGLTINDGGSVTVAEIPMANLAGVNTGALVHYENLTCSVNNNKYYLSDGTTTLQVYNSLYAFDALVAGKTYNITGIYQQYNTTKEILPRSVADIEEVVVTTPSITVSPATVNAPFAGADGSLTITYENIPDLIAFDIQFCDANGDELQGDDPDWIDTEIQEENNVYSVYYVIGANDGEARSTYFKVYTYTGSNLDEVYSNLVTVNQAEYVAPTYAGLPFSFNGGRADIENTDGLSQEGLGTDYNASTNPTTKLKFDSTGDWVLLQFNERPGTLTFNIKGNSFSGSTFKVQISEDGITYTDLETYTELGDTQDESFNNLGENVRYIKWIYTEKSSGNVGLGNIALAAYAEPVASITVADGDANIDVDANGVENATLAIAYESLTITDPADFDIQYYDANNEPLEKENEPDWMEASIQVNTTQDGYEVSYSVDPNDGEARTAYFKVFAMGDQDFVYSNLVTVSQEAYVAPTATITVADGDANIDVDAIGVENATLAIAYENLTITDPADFNIQYYNANGDELGKDDEPIWMAASIQENATQDGYEVLYDVFENDGEARTAYFKVFAMGDQDFVYSNLVTINQAAYVVDYATLPFEWVGSDTNGSSSLTAMSGVTAYDLGSDYAASNAPYRVKLDNTDDYIQVKTNEQPGVVTLAVKMLGGANTSYITVKGSTDGETFDDGEALEISGAQNAELTLTSTRTFDADVRFVRMVFTRGSNVGVGSIAIAPVDHTPSITAADVEITYDATGGSIAYTINNPVSGGALTASKTAEWLTLGTVGNESVAFTCSTNTASTARTATVTLTYTFEDSKASVTKDVTVTQAAAPAPTFTVSFAVGDGGTFVPNTDFPTVEESKLAGEYTLPSATKSGLTFDGWKLDGTDDIYDAGAQYEVTGNVSFTATYTEIVDYATLPFEWVGSETNGSSSLTAMSGVTANGLGSDYAASNAPYRIKLDGTGDYIQVKTNEQPGVVTLAVKMLGGANTSYITVKGSTDGETFDDGEALEISGAQNDELTLTSTRTFDADVRFVRMVFTKGSNVGVGSIAIAQVDHTPSITAADVEITYDATGGSIAYTINNVVSGGTLTASTESDWLTLSTEFANPIQFTCNANEATSARTATVTLTYIYNAKESVTKNVTVTQAAAPAPTFTVSFAVGDGGTFVPNTDFPTVEESKPAGTYTLPSATKEGYTFTGWNDGTTTYAGGAEYTVSADVTFTAQWTEIPAGATYTLVETDNDIVPGQHYIIVGIGGTDSKYYAMGSQNTNYRNRVEVTANGTTIAYIEGVYEVVLSGYRDNTTNTWTIYDEVTVVDEHTGGYLYASGTGSSNYLSTQVTNSDRGQWSISINAESHKATIQANTTATERKILKYNHNSSRFSCYSGGQQDIYLYKKNNDKTYNFYSNTTVASLTVANDGACIVHEDVALEVTGTITNNGGADNILIENLGQLINKNNVVATLQRDIKGYGDDPNVADGWQTIASPVDGISTSVVATAPYDLYMYNEPNAYWYSNTGSVPFNTLSRSIGYLYANANDMTLNFAGEMIRTDQVVPQTLSYTSNQTDDVRGYNLMGNPFTCNLNAGDVKIDGNNVTSYSIAIPTSANLVTYIINERPIKTGEGFFVQASDENQEISFVKTASKDGVANNGYISINANTEVNFDNAYIQIGNGNTLRKMSIATSSVVYVMNDGDDYAAARVEELAGSMPVYFDAAEDGQCTITITANNLVAHSMHLIDNFTGEDIDLLVNPSYTFFANESDDAARFTLMFDFNDYTGVNESYVNGNFAYQSGDELFISGDGTLQVFDVMGRFVMSKEIHGSESVSVSAFETGVYMLRFVGETVMTQKIVIR